MDIAANFTIRSISGEEVFTTERVYQNIEKQSEENKMLRDLAKMKTELIKAYDLDIYKKDNVKLSVSFQSRESTAKSEPIKKARSEKDLLISSIKALDI